MACDFPGNDRWVTLLWFVFAVVNTLAGFGVYSIFELVKYFNLVSLNGSIDKSG